MLQLVLVLATFSPSQAKNEEVIDVVAEKGKKWLDRKKTQAAERFDFDDHDRLDVKIHRTMAVKEAAEDSREERGLPVFTIMLPEDAQTPLDILPPRMERWLDQVRRTDGQVLTCVYSNEHESLAAGLLKLLNLAVVRIIHGIDEYVTYKPAGRYHAAVLVDPEDTDTVVAFRFAHRLKFGALDGSSCAPVTNGTTQQPATSGQVE